MIFFEIIRFENIPSRTRRHCYAYNRPLAEHQTKAMSANNKEFRITDYNLRNGRRISPRNLDELKDEIERMQNAKAKLLEIGYKVGGGIGSRERNETSMYRLNDECGELKKDYKAKKLDKENIGSNPYKIAKKKWKKVKLYGKKIGDAASRIITFCVKQVGKKNLRAMQQATSSPTFCGWTTGYISRRCANEEGIFTNQFNALEEKDETPYGQPLRPNDSVPILDDIKNKEFREWSKQQSIKRRQLLHVDIWNRDKKLNRVLADLLVHMGPNITMTLCWANPICVFEKSIREMRAEEIKKEAIIAYHEAQRKSLKHWEHTARIQDASVVSWYSGGNQDIISDTLRGFPPDNFDEMMESYKEHQERLYQNAEDEECAYYGAVEELNFWKWEQKQIRNDLEIMMENIQEQDEEEEMREEEIERLEELQEYMRGYGSD